MLIYEALKKDHDVLKGHLERLVHSADASKEAREKIINTIRDDLVPHSRAEEAVFYNSLREIPETRDLVMHGYQEHMEAETILRALQAMDIVGADWHKLATKLQQGILHHIAEEEGDIFSAAQQVLAVEEAEMMTTAFQELKPQVKEQGFVQTTLDLIANLMPTRFATTIRQYQSRQ
jgi:hemerythrin-like domain-containing protein